jgi:polysaccharide chain length determinant protein (PEP-CTERM system associated)
LEDELKKVGASLEGLEARVADFKEKNINTLPELLQVNLQTLNNLERNIELLTEQLRSQKEREGQFQGELANVSPELEAAQKDRQRLEELKVELVHLKSRFTSEYPDVRKTEAEIAKLERQMADGNRSSGRTKPDNPAYITLASQLSSTRAEIRSIQEQIRGLSEKAETYRRYIETTPKVEETYNALLSERNNTKAKHDDLMQKLMEARVSQGLETEQKGERFTLIDPARLPEKPYKPNRLAIFLIGVVLGIGAGIGTAALREFSDTSVQSIEHLSKATSFPVLATIPIIVTAGDMARQRVKRIAWVVGIVLVVIGSLAVFHFQVMDLNVFWAKLMRKMPI